MERSSLHNQGRSHQGHRQRETSRQGFRQLLTSPEYEKLRGKLIRIFARRGCPFPQDLADETISRVAQKVDDVAAAYDGDPVRYFYGVARNVYLEYTRRPKTVPLEENKIWVEYHRDSGRKEKAHACLDQCLKQLSSDERNLIREYYRYDKSAKIDRRKELAEELGIALNALRIKTYRIRQILYRCVAACSKRNAGQK